MIKLAQMNEMKFTQDNIKYDYDNYVIEVKTGLSTKEFNITIDFINHEITGDCVAFGGWFDIEKDKCIEIMKQFLIDNEPNRDFSHILIK